MTINPFKALIFKLILMQSRNFPVHVIQIPHQVEQTTMQWVVENIPVEWLIEIPLHPLTEFASHE